MLRLLGESLHFIVQPTVAMLRWLGCYWSMVEILGSWIAMGERCCTRLVLSHSGVHCMKIFKGKAAIT